MGSEGELDIGTENWPRTSDRERNGGVAYRRLVKIKEFGVPAQDSVVPRVPVYAGAKVERIAILAIYRRSP